MKIKTDWKSPPSFEDQYPNEWARIEKLLKRINLPFTCHIGYEDVGSKVYLVMSDGEDRHDDLVYTLSKFTTISEEELNRDILERAQRPIGQKKEIIQGVFDHFQQLHEWPSSRLMSVELRHLGEYYKLAKGIGSQFIITGEDHVVDANTRLTIYGVSLCSEAEEYLDAFLKILKFLLSKYLEMPELPVVSSEEMVDEDIFSYGDENFIYELVSNEFMLASGSTREKSGKFTLTVSPAILNYEDVNTIEDYLRIAYYPRIWEQTEDNVDPYPERAIEIVGPEGIIVTESKSSKQFDYDLFISYSSKDQDVADAIYSALDEVDLVPFLAPKDIDSGDIGSEQIRKALLNSAEVVVLMSPNSINSLWVITEWGAAWVLRKRITPILLECKIEDIPKLLQDMQKRDYPSEIDRFIKEALKRKTNAP